VRSTGKAPGVIASNAEKANQLIAQGFQLIIIGSDQDVIRTIGRKHIKGIKG
jgi:2-keto-3-deoxy-L-rhamnonate aldolase RhmA